VLYVQWTAYQGMLLIGIFTSGELSKGEYYGRDYISQPIFYIS
jgi:hypothetical protein